MNKNILLDFINKYSLGGEIKMVVWDFNKGLLSVRGITGDKSVVIELKGKSTIMPKHFTIKSGVYNTTNLSRLLLPLDDEIELDIIANKKMIFNDKSNTISQYILSSISVIPTPPNLVNLPDTWEKDFVIDTNLIEKIIISSRSLPDAETFTIINDSLIIGYSSILSNQVELPLVLNKATQNKKMGEISFNLKAFVDFLKSHNDCDNINIRISEQGIMRVETENDNFHSVFYFVSTNPIT